MREVTYTDKRRCIERFLRFITISRKFIEILTRALHLILALLSYGYKHHALSTNKDLVGSATRASTAIGVGTGSLIVLGSIRTLTCSSSTLGKSHALFVSAAELIELRQLHALVHTLDVTEFSLFKRNL